MNNPQNGHRFPLMYTIVAFLQSITSVYSCVTDDPQRADETSLCIEATAVFWSLLVTIFSPHRC